jgi:hypothetical protein
MLDRAPSCAILHNRNELKVYQDNQVYLNDGDNFELRFFNPTNFKIGVEIVFNGLKKGDGYLVLNPGQDLILDRFLDEQRKMLFETYVVDGNNEAAVKAIQQNGLISFNFHKENSYNNNYKTNVDINYNFPPIPNRPVYQPNTTYVTNNYYGNGIIISGSTGWSGSGGYAGVSGTLGCAGPAGAPGFYGSGSISTMNISSNLTQVTSSTSTPNYKFASRSYTTPGVFSQEVDNSCTTDSLNYSDYIAENLDSSINFSDYVAQSTINPLETGRIEKGDISNQTLKSVNAQFQSSPFHSITYKLMPISSMNKTIKEVRTYCPECGYRLRKENWKYCPKCGSKID